MKMAAVPIVVLAMAVAACGGSNSMEVTDAWGRSSPQVAQAGAFYVTVENGTGTGDRLVAAASDRCGMTELHTTVMTDGVMSMRPAEADQLSIREGERLDMEPGGLHVMCMGLVEPLVAGEEIPLTLTFAEAGDIEVTISIEDR